MNEPTNCDGLTFDEWWSLADESCHDLSKGAAGLLDLPDGPSWDSWNDGVRPKDYAYDLLEEEGYPFATAPATAPEPVRKNTHERGGYNLAPHGETYTEVLVTESGTSYVIQKNHSANGRYKVLDIIPPTN